MTCKAKTRRRARATKAVKSNAALLSALPADDAKRLKKLLKREAVSK